MVGLLHAMAFMVLLLIGWVIWNNKPLPLPFIVDPSQRQVGHPFTSTTLNVVVVHITTADEWKIGLRGNKMFEPNCNVVRDCMFGPMCNMFRDWMGGHSDVTGSCLIFKCLIGLSFFKCFYRLCKWNPQIVQLIEWTFWAMGQYSNLCLKYS